MAAATAIGAVGERQSQTEALPLQGAADGLVMSHQPAALFPSPYLEPWISTGVTTDYHSDAYHPGETIEPTPSVVQAVTARAASQGGSLTEAEMIAVLTEAGWPAELHAVALAVSWCESRWSPYAVGDGGRSLGLFQLNQATWFPYAGENPELWDDPLVNARTAWATYNYDLGRGYVPWKQWSCKP